MRRSDGRGCWRWDQEKEEGREGTEDSLGQIGRRGTLDSQCQG